MGAEMENMYNMLQNVGKNPSECTRLGASRRTRLKIKAYRRRNTSVFRAVQAGMTEEQIQDIAMGVVAAAMESQMAMIPMIRDEEPPAEQQMEMPQ